MEIIHFARESSKNELVTLTPNRWRQGVMTSKPWLVDFFAPWCPPCKAMLPEFRQISTKFHDLKFGTIDWVMHPEFCSQFNIG